MAKKDDSRVDTAFERLQIISPLLSLRTDTPLEKHLYREKARQIARLYNKDERTIIEWHKAYKSNKGYQGLMPKYPTKRSDCRLPPDYDQIVERAVEIRKLCPAISVRDIIGCLESEKPELTGLINRATMQRHLQKKNCSKREVVNHERYKGRKVFGRYQAERVNERWQGDVKESPKTGLIDEQGKPVRLFTHIFIDDCSRYIVDHEIGSIQDKIMVLTSLKRAVATHGAPDSLLLDNGSPYRNKLMTEITGKLNIKLIYCKPRSAWVKGKIERLNLDLNKICAQVSAAKPMPAMTYAKAIEQAIHEHNTSPHSALGGRTPEEVYLADLNSRRRIDAETLALCFKQPERRTIAKDGSISVYGSQFKADLSNTAVGGSVSVLITRSTGGMQVEQILNDGSCVVLEPQHIGTDVDRSVYSTEPLGVDPSAANPYMARLLRESDRRAGQYSDEAAFQAGLDAMLNSTPAEGTQEASAGSESADGTWEPGSAENSPYLQLARANKARSEEGGQKNG